ncbi:hypothetical protein KM043_004340 [Ampulex compressa]|nr:hypothetical protein KM043_004340 [Ampulex compressa]
MALSRELLKRLQSDEEPLAKRLKLAENAFHAVDLPVVRKENLILEWLCSACTINHEQLDDVIFDFENKIQNITLYEYCQKVVHDILSKQHITDIDYDLLTQLTYFNPLIIEKKIPDILKKIFLPGQPMKYTCLLIAILDASVRLRREEKFISHLLMALKSSSKYMFNSNACMFFPHEFRNKFIKSVNNITNTQAIAMLKTLSFYLNRDCAEVLQYNTTHKCIVMMKPTIELLVFLFEGACVFECNGTIASQQKFVDALNNIGQVLSQLVDKALHLNHNKEIIIMLLTAVSSWSKVQNMLKYYVPKAIIHNLSFPISEDQWLQLIQRITNFGEDSCKNNMNELILHRFKISQNIFNERPITLNILIGGLENVWHSVLKFNPEIILFLSDMEVSKLAHFLLKDITSNEESFEQWSTVLEKECLQENKPLMISLLSHILIDIGKIANTGITKSVTKHIETKSLVEAEVFGSKQILKILDVAKEKLSLNKWVQFENTNYQNVILHLRVLNYVPLVFLSINVRILTFLVIYSIFRESDQCNEIKILCSKIFTDLLEKAGLNIFQYMDPILILEHMTQDRELHKAIAQSLRYTKNYSDLKNYIKLSSYDEGVMCTLLECIENIKSKINADQKPAFKKAEKILSKKILSTLKIDITKPEILKRLSLALKIAISKKKVSEDLKSIAESTLCDIFTIDNELPKNDQNKLLKESLQLAIIILRNHKIFNIKDDTIKSLWHVMLKCTYKDLLLPLLESTRQKEFQELLNILLLQTDKNMTKLNGETCENIFVIWDAVIKTDMSTKRNKLRLAAIDKLCQNMQLMDVPHSHWPHVLILLQNIVAAKHLYISGHVIDISIVLAIKSLEDADILICNNVLILCGILVKSRTSLITDRLHALLLLYRHVLNFVVCVSKTPNNKFEEHQVRCLALDVERFTSLLIKLKKDMTRLSPYLVADMLQLFMDTSSTSSMKTSIQNCIGQLISICDEHGGSYIWIPPLKQYTEEQTLQQKSRVNSFDGIDQQSIQK